MARDGVHLQQWTTAQKRVSRVSSEDGYNSQYMVSKAGVDMVKRGSLLLFH